MEKIRVIVADDHPVFREGLTRLLDEQNDIEVIATPEDGIQTVELTSKLKPDVLVIDISMPRLNGLEASKQIKTISPETAILILSAYSFPSYVLAALKAGAGGYLMKNTQLDKIVSAIHMVHSGKGVFNSDVTAKLLYRLAASKMDKLPESQELHPRELQILNLAAVGKGNKQIGNQLNISERTVQTHLVNIFRKLEVNSRTEAIIRALKEGWLILDELVNNENTGD